MSTSLSEIKATTAHRIGWFQALTNETNSTVNVSNETEIEMPNASTLLIHSMVGSSIQVAQGTDLQLRLGRVGEILKICDVAPWIESVGNSKQPLAALPCSWTGGLEHGF